MNEPMTHIHCTSCRRRIPYEEPPFTTLCRTQREVCLDCKPQTRGRTGPAPGDTEAMAETAVHAQSDSSGGGVSDARLRLASPKWRLPVPDGPHIPAGEG